MSLVQSIAKDNNVSPQEPRHVTSLRHAARARAATLQFPTRADEAWHFTDPAPLQKMQFHAVTKAGEINPADIEKFIVPEADSRLVFVDGVYAPELSQTRSDRVLNFQQAWLSHADLITAHFGLHTDHKEDIFIAQNTAEWQDGAFVWLGKNDTQPVHILYVATGQDSAKAIYPRLLIMAESQTKTSVVEDYVALGEQVYFSNCVTEIVVQDGAEINHSKIQREAKTAFHVANCNVQLGKNSQYKSQTISLGARLSRYNLMIKQNEEGTHAELDGLALINGRQTADTRTEMDHAKPHGSSSQLHKCIVDGAAHAVFNGIVYVRKGAQLTDSKQSSRNLLLSGKAHVDTKPQLEIFADDVKCAHGATVGQLDQDELFYLKSRGLDDATARKLLTYAFAAEIIEKIPVDSIRESLEATVFTQTQMQEAL